MELTAAKQGLFAQMCGGEGLLRDGWFDLHALLDRFAVQVGAIARSTGKFIEVTTSEQTPRYFSGDHLRFTDLLNNVVGYALTHLDDGGILLDVHAYPIKKCQYRIDIVIVTTGIGIPSHKFNTAFLPDCIPGEQSHKSLFLAKTICSLMGGDLTINNTFGWGTRYLIHLIMESEVPGYPAQDGKGPHAEREAPV